ncbi:MAG: glutamine--fructose-6-phosphate transaminase (isomerizing) [Candidatus Cyclonatronum sp.]|uniref:glutamine--fructose-6-phosphate transaminase (isomerizing) n=1 Tax=Cyclonatronum sp. TaxID=3024185 RepID=UPI0025BE6691|nr:glutamine--fructose-6-phosphate transaminase (isomerizing) [Cyclonatronum sp.]MCC5933480.1 glutamine--fructose-6-phosphate transaminase (isomerizing) [Balneolales bacterium]MCH8485229.1 glutamine--fructose-6-phosphate transaminase (isomerizing) [Cyclonatronum sp.]
MCGIVGYIGFREASDVIIKGLKRLEYRGYDSAGIAILNGTLIVRKGKGKVANLESLLTETDVTGTIGIGHTRWATHGEPNDINAHPHWDGSQNFAIVHNGIIENYDALKKELSNKGHIFQGETDTEVLAHLIEEIQRVASVDFETAVQMALKQVDGTYGLAIVNKNERDKIIVARKGSPLLLGIGDNEVFIASDASPIIEYTNKVVYLDDDEMAIISRDGYQVKTISNVKLSKEVHELEMNIEQIEKGGYAHFMLKEIHEQSQTIADCMRGRLIVEDNKIVLGGIEAVTDRLVNARRLIIAACGTSWHAGLVGEYLIEHLAKMSVEVEYASEFRYRDPLITKEDVMLVISQSGETADTLAAVREARSKGALVLGICNVVGSTIARETDAGVYTHAGPEIGVASTKAFTAQVTVLTMMAILLGQRRKTLAPDEASKIIKAMSEIPKKVAEIMTKFDEIDAIARLFAYAPNFLYLGRSYNFPVALEGALKLKEISYIHAEGYPAAEMKHGPIALIDELMPVVVLASAAHTNDKMVSNIEEVRARKGRVIAITTDNNKDVQRLAEFSVTIPETHDLLTPLLTVIPLQILSYQIAVYRKCNVDQPRNLAKSVTVE